jgi:hypothetical protein
MSLGQKLINRTGAQARKVKRNPLINFEDVNEQMKTLASSDGAQKLILSAQRQTDPSFGLAVLAQKIEISKLVAQDAALARVGSRLQVTLSNIGLAEQVQYQAYADAPSGIHQVANIALAADDDGSLNNKYFLINSANNTHQYYVWFNVGGNGLDPMVAHRTGIPVSIYPNASPAVIAVALAPALNAANGGADFSAAASGNNVIVTYQALGPANAPTDGNPALSAAAAQSYYIDPASLNRGTGFTYSITTLGQLALALAGKYFVLNDSAGTVAVWYKVGGSGSAPVGFHRTLEVDVASLASASAVAQATALILAADSQFLGVANASKFVASNKSAGFFGNGPGSGTSTFLLSELQRGNSNISDLLRIKVGDLMEILSGILKGKFFTIHSIAGDVLLSEEDPGAIETGESGQSLRFEMRTTIPKILVQSDSQE